MSLTINHKQKPKARIFRAFGFCDYTFAVTWMSVIGMKKIRHIVTDFLLELLGRFELPTSSLPRMRSTC